MSPIEIDPCVLVLRGCLELSVRRCLVCSSVSRTVTDLCTDAPPACSMHSVGPLHLYSSFIPGLLKPFAPGTAHRCLSSFITLSLCSRSGMREPWWLHHTHSVASRSGTLITLPHAGLLSLKLQPIDRNNIFITIILCLPKHLEGPLGPK